MFILIAILFGLALLVTGIILSKGSTGGDWRDPVGFIAIAIGGFALIVPGVVWPCHYFGHVSEIEGFIAVEQTVAYSRSSEGREIESAALVLEMAQRNAWLAKTKYWNDTFWCDWLTPDAVNDLQPIK